jgi:hypothetical protein
MELKIPWYQDAVMIGVMIAMIGWNIERLIKFLEKDWREYKLFSLGRRNLKPINEATLRVEKYPMRKVMREKKDDIIQIKKNDRTPPIKILPEQITSLNTVEKEQDLLIEITYKNNETDKIEQVLLNLDDRVIKGVKKGVNELRGHDETSFVMRILDRFSNI